MRLRTALLTAVLALTLIMSPARALGAGQNGSIVRLSINGGHGVCTAFVINQEKRFYLTDDHCIDTDMAIGDASVEEVFHAPEIDIAVVQAVGPAGVALKPFLGEITQADGYVAKGFANGLETMTEIKTRVVFPIFAVDQTHGTWMLTWPTVIPGMSGGPVQNEAGEVITVVEVASPRYNLSISRPMSVIYEATKPYWTP